MVAHDDESVAVKVDDRVKVKSMKPYVVEDEVDRVRASKGVRGSTTDWE